ncbi:MAG TPA: hypothetical protein VF786_02515 [Terriglobales bacterium]
MRKSWHIVFVLVLGLAFLSSFLPAQTAQKSEPQKEDAKAAARATGAYKLEYSIFEVEGTKRVNARKYVLYATDDGRDVRLKTGSRVPFFTSDKQWQYVEVGVSIRPNLVERDNVLLLISQIEASSVPPEQKEPAPPIMRQLEARACNAVVLGKPILIASMDDAASNRRYEVEVTVTKQ